MATRGTPCVRALLAAGVAHALHEYEAAANAQSYGAAAAAALGVEPARVFKTLVAEVDGRPVVAIVAVTGLVDLKALSRAAGGKRAQLADPALAERLTGYVTGGISPLGQKRALPTFADRSLADWPTVYVSGGRRGLEVELAPADLLRVATATLVEGLGAR